MRTPLRLRTHVRWTAAAVVCGGMLASAAGQRLEQRAVLDGRMLISVPEGFEEMDPEMLLAKYPSERRPRLVYTNADGTVNVAISHTSSQVPNGNVTALHANVTATFKKLFPAAKWYRSEVVQINGRTWFLLDLRTPAMDTEVRNVMIGTSLDGRMLAVSFNVTKELETEWMPAAYVIVKSVVVR